MHKTDCIKHQEEPTTVGHQYSLIIMNHTTISCAVTIALVLILFTQSTQAVSTKRILVILLCLHYLIMYGLDIFPNCVSIYSFLPVQLSWKSLDQNLRCIRNKNFIAHSTILADLEIVNCYITLWPKKGVCFFALTWHKFSTHNFGWLCISLE